MLSTKFTESVTHTGTGQANNGKFGMTLNLNVDDNYTSLSYKEITSAFRKLEQLAVKLFCSKPKQEHNQKKGVSYE